MQISKISVHHKFWRDWKDICKKHKGKELISWYAPSEFTQLDDEAKMDSIVMLKSIKNMVVNATNDGLINMHASLYDRQPFLNSGWTIYKMRWAIDNKGKRGGLRIIFCINEGHVLFTFIATKNDCDDERQLESEFLRRIKEYFSV
jgi:hypothetical protein